MPLWARVPLSVVALYVLYVYLVWLERCIIARLASSGDPRWGALGPLASALRALRRRGLLPSTVRRGAVMAGAVVSLAATLSALLLIPTAPPEALRGPLSAGVNLGWVVALWVLSSATLLLGACCSRNAYLRAEGRRAAVQAWGYAVPALLAGAGVALLSGTATLEGVLRAQRLGWPWVVHQPLGAAVFALSLLVASRRLPYALPGATDTLLGEFHLQHSGTALALYHWAEYGALLLASALASTLYLGGTSGPVVSGAGWLLLKTVVVSLALLWLRRRWLAPRQQRWGARLWWGLMALAAMNTALVMWLPRGG